MSPALHSSRLSRRFPPRKPRGGKRSGTASYLWSRIQLAAHTSIAPPEMGGRASGSRPSAGENRSQPGKNCFRHPSFAWDRCRLSGNGLSIRDPRIAAKTKPAGMLTRAVLRVVLTLVVTAFYTDGFALSPLSGGPATFISPGATRLGVSFRTGSNIAAARLVPGRKGVGVARRLRAVTTNLGLRMASGEGDVIDVQAERVGEDLSGPKIPITLLSGFLGSGKTTLLREMLTNKEGTKVGVIVNDMAAVNIDSKLVISDGQKKKSAGDFGVDMIDTSDVMQLENGCACCSASDELLQSLLKLLVVAAEKGEMYDRIVIESSGVSEPKNVRQTFFMNEASQHPAFDYAKLQNMVTVVDSGNFLSMYQSGASLEMRPHLVEEDSLDTNSNRRVVELLTEQLEVADYILLNKADMVDSTTMDRLKQVVSALNPTAEVVACEFGKVGKDVVLGSSRKSWVAERDDEDDFRASASAIVAPAPNTRAAAEMEAHGHSHSHDAACADPECKDESHGHSHSHDAACVDTECKDESHGHSHSHDAACVDPECKDESHGHSHSHAHTESCSDPTCTDESHGHSHSHSHSHEATPEEKFGISSFVYLRRRPFAPSRLKKAILKLPISGNSEATEGHWKIISDDTARDKASPLHRVIRSKGFVWLANNHRDPLYWSHAGQFFDLKDFGMFWASTPAEWWPSDAQSLNQIGADFGGEQGEWGDRRQEVVFIGVDLDQKGIEAQLDECLATDAEMEEYRKLATQKPDRCKLDFSTSPPTPIDIPRQAPAPRAK